MVIDPYGTWDDPTRQAAYRLIADPVPLCQALAARLGTALPRRREWPAAWRRAAEAARASLTQVLAASDGGWGTVAWIYRPLVEMLPDGAIVYVANSMAVRDLDTFTELPDRSILFHVDRDDVFAASKKLGHKFAISGGIPNILLSFGKPAEVHDFCRRVIDEVAPEGGYIMDAGAIMQDDTSIENIRAMTDTCRDQGVYSAGSYAPPTPTPPAELPASVADRAKLTGMAGRPMPRIRPGVCYPWEDKVKKLPEITGDPAMIRRVWEDIDGLGNMFIWQCLLSF